MCASTPTTVADSSLLLHVIAAVIRGPDQQILIARRPAHLHQGGKWEFPGGKREPGETRYQALVRELDEELGIAVQVAQPLLQVVYHYPEKSILLDVWEVTQFAGEPEGREGQAITWVTSDELDRFEFPAANQPVISAARLPDRYWITPDPEPHEAPLLAQQLSTGLSQGIRMLQLRTKSWPLPLLQQWLASQHELLTRFKPIVLINSDVLDSRLQQWSLLRPYCQGVHLTASALQQLQQRPALQWVAASCHGRADLQKAQALGVDFVTLSPLRETLSHPGVAGMGSSVFSELVAEVNLPVYALGGMSAFDVAQVRHWGGQGVAGIRALFSAD